MYRPQQHLYSQNDPYQNFHVRQPDTILFEDSPQNKASYEQDSSAYVGQSYKRGAGEIKLYQKQLEQSEESGGGMKSSDRASNNLEPTEEDEKEGEGDIEFIIMNLYSKMKNLESKYIDLANFYKQELVKTSTNRRPTLDDEQRMNPYNYGRITPSKTFDRSQDMALDQSVSLNFVMDQPGNKSSGRDEEMPSEREIIKDLIEEKKKLEDDMKHAIQLKQNQLQAQNFNFQQSPMPPNSGISEFKTDNGPQEEEARRALQGVLREVMENLDQTQKKELQILTSKQNEMFSLANKCGMPSQIRSESISLWYDAKTKIAQCMGDMKYQVQQHQKELEGMKGKPKIRQKQEAELGQNEVQLNQQQAKDLASQLKAFRRKIEQTQKELINLKNQQNFKEINMREDQAKLMQMLKEIQASLGFESSKKDHLLFSGDKHAPALSPFEKRIANYQKSAEMRKQDYNRSGSRGRGPSGQMASTGSNFYQSREYMNPPQILPSQHNYIQREQQMDMDEVNHKNLRNKLRSLEYVLEDMDVNQNAKLQGQQEQDQNIQNMVSETVRFLKNMEEFTQNIGKGPGGQMNKTTVDKSREQMLSPNARQYDNNFYSGQRQTLQDKKILELQRNNDQLFGDLRKANEKYLNQKVDNNKLVDEIQVLQAALQESNQQLRKQQQLQASEAQPSKQKIVKKAYPTSQRTDASQIPPTSQSMNQASRGRQSSTSSFQLSRENEDLKRKVQELEKECFTLTYYQQEVQRNNQSDPLLKGMQQENQEMKCKIDQLCLKVQRFLFSMKRLQRAVNNKDKDIQIYKAEFEANKKALETLVKDTKEALETQPANRANKSISSSNGLVPTNHSMMATWDKREGRFAEMGGTGQRGKSQNPTAFQGTPSQMGVKRMMNTSQNRKYGRVEAEDNQLETQEDGQHTGPNPQEQKFNQLIEEIGQMQKMGEQQRKAIEELKEENEKLLADKNGFEVQLQSKNINSQKLSQQLKACSETINRQDVLLDEYKDALSQAENNPQKKLVQKLRHDLLVKEKDLIHAQLNPDKFQSQSQKDLHQERELQKQINSAQIQQVKEELLAHLSEKEAQMEEHFQGLHQLVQDKENEIEKVKKVMVQKLKEIETSFVEINQEVVENENLQQEASKRMQSQLQQNTSQKQELEKSIDNIIGKYEEDQREEELNQLVASNEALMALNSQLQQQVKELETELEKAKLHSGQSNELETLRQQYEDLQQQVEEQKSENFSKFQTMEVLIGEKRQLQTEVRTLNKKVETIGLQYQKTINAQAEQLEEQKGLLQLEQEKCVLFESEFKNKEKVAASIKQEMKVLEEQNNSLKQKEKDLLSQIENQKQEHAYLSKLQKEENSLNESLDVSQQAFDDQQELAKIDSNPKESAQSYYRMLKATNKELLILQKSHETQTRKFEEQKVNMNELKQESRQCVEQNLNMETKIFDLENENNKLTTELTKQKGDMKVEEEVIRREIEAEFKDLIKFKETEIESMSSKLERITISNAEMTTRLSRLEANLIELSTENEGLRSKVSSLEMELEMTKANAERDLDHVIEQEQQKLVQEKQRMEGEGAQAKRLMDEKIKEAEQQRKALEDKIGRKKQKMGELKKNKDENQKQGFMQEVLKQGLEQKLVEMQTLMEEEKKAREHSEQEKKKLLQEQERERQQMLEEQTKERKAAEQKKQEKSFVKQQRQTALAEEQKKLEEQTKRRHREEVESMERRFKQDREDLQKSLSQNEKDQIETIKNQLQKEKEEQLRQKEEEQKQKLEEERIRKEQEMEVMMRQYEREKKELEEIQENQKAAIEEKLLQDQKEFEKLHKRRISLIAVLQKKARESLLIELERAKEQQKLKEMELHALSKEQRIALEQQEKEREELMRQQNDAEERYQRQLQEKEIENQKRLIDLESKLGQEKDDYKKLLEEVNLTKSVEVEQLRKRLEEEKNSELKKRESEKTLLEKMQEKVRIELEKQLEDAVNDAADKEKQAKKLEADILQKEKDIHLERVNQQELIDELNSQVRSSQQQKLLLDKENASIKRELELLKKQQAEKEKGVVKELRELIHQKVEECERLNGQNQKNESEINTLKGMLQQKEKEIFNLEKDLDQFVKEQEEERQQVEQKQEQLEQTIRQLTENRDSIQNKKSESEMAVKIKEGLLTQLQAKVEEQQKALEEKELEIADSKSKSQRTFNQQINDLKDEHAKQLKLLEDEKKAIEERLESLTARQKEQAQLNQSINEVEKKLENFEVELVAMKKKNKQIEEIKTLNDSLINYARTGEEVEIIGELGSQNLMYCKRVRYLEKAWILVQKNNNYYWIDQEQIPLQKIQRIDVSEMEQTCGKLQERLEALIIDKEAIQKQLDELGYSSQQKLSSQRAHLVEQENRDLNQRVLELEFNNNQLQQNNLQLKAKIKELNDMVFGLTDTDKNHDNLKKIYDFQKKNEELTQKLLEAFDQNQALEGQLDEKNNELEKLKKQIQEMDYSFAKGHNQNSVENKPENFNLEASSIMHQQDDDQQDEFSKMKQLETEVEEVARINGELERRNQTLVDEISELRKKSKMSMGEEDKEWQDQMRHTRGILIKFLEKTPVTTKENEDLLTIIFSMMLFTKDEIAEMQKSRVIQTEQQVKQATKKGMFGMWGNKGAK